MRARLALPSEPICTRFLQEEGNRQCRKPAVVAVNYDLTYGTETPTPCCVECYAAMRAKYPELPTLEEIKAYKALPPQQRRDRLLMRQANERYERKRRRGRTPNEHDE